ncbi:integrase, catalytic region, zinc finger, CCHC-type containing protein [Tanacetum coccineum]
MGITTANQSKVIRCYNCKGEGHMARQCTQPKKLKNSEWFKEKIMLAQAHEVGIDDLDAFDSDCDEAPSASAFLMAKLFAYDLDVLSEQIIFHDIMCTAMHSYDDLVKYTDMEKSYIDEYNMYLEIEAELSKKKDMVEKAVYDELSNRFEDMKIGVFLLRLNLKVHIATLKGKSVSDCTAPVNNSKVIASGMFKLDLPPLSSKLKKNRKAHVDYLKQTKEHADTLREIIEQTRALKPLDNALEYPSDKPKTTVKMEFACNDLLVSKRHIILKT